MSALTGLFTIVKTAEAADDGAIATVAQSTGKGIEAIALGAVGQDPLLALSLLLLAIVVIACFLGFCYFHFDCKKSQQKELAKPEIVEAKAIAVENVKQIKQRIRQKRSSSTSTKVATKPGRRK